MRIVFWGDPWDPCGCCSESGQKMGVSQSRQEVEEDNEQEDDDEEEDDNDASGIRELDNHSVKKVLEQEPEMLPCYASASPLSPQLSSFGTPRLGPSIKVWDPYNVLAPPPPPPPAAVFSRSFSSSGLEEDRMVIEVFFISHGESDMNLRPDLVAGRCPGAGLTPNGKRQARALAVFLNSQGIRFNAVYSSPLDRARATAASVCQVGFFFFFSFLVWFALDHLLSWWLDWGWWHTKKELCFSMVYYSWTWI